MQNHHLPDLTCNFKIDFDFNFNTMQATPAAPISKVEVYQLKAEAKVQVAQGEDGGPVPTHASVTAAQSL